MKLKPQVGGNGGEIVQVEPGTYEAVLEEVRGYRGKRYKSEEYEPKLVFIWNLGEDEDGNPILRDSTDTIRIMASGPTKDAAVRALIDKIIAQGGLR